MKIIIAHNRYQQLGGEDVVVRQESQMLRDRGHEVVLYERSNDETDRYTGAQRLTLFAHTAWSTDTRREFAEVLKRERPDVVHVHNTLVMISPSIYEACKDAGVPVVQTLHNYRFFCPASSFSRDGVPCEDCVTGSLLASVKHKCYRGSTAATAAVATMLALHRKLGTYENGIDRYIALTEFARNKFIECGLPAEKIVVKPNFVYPDPGVRTSVGNWAVFVGRLTPEKGMATALRAWKLLPADIELKVIGDGPSMQELQGMARELGLKNVTFLGKLPREQAFEYVSQARFLLFPSEWYETFGMTMIEAYAQGVPVIASRMGVMPEIVKHNETGLLFEPRDPRALADAVEDIWNKLGMIRRLGQRARTEYEQLYSVDENYRQLIGIYNSVVRKQQESACFSAA